MCAMLLPWDVKPGRTDVTEQTDAHLILAALIYQESKRN
jgi:hypothetical protein